MSIQTGDVRRVWLLTFVHILGRLIVRTVGWGLQYCYGEVCAARVLANICIVIAGSWVIKRLTNMLVRKRELSKEMPKTISSHIPSLEAILR